MQSVSLCYSSPFSLYFANSGLRTRLDLLNTGQVWWTLLVLILLASAAKIIPVTLICKLCTKKPWHYCSSIGVLMNTRGIVQLVVLNIGVELNVIPKVVFAMFVLMATVLTFLTSPILYLLYRKDFDVTKLSRVSINMDSQSGPVSDDLPEADKEKQTTVRWSRQSTTENVNSSRVYLTVNDPIINGTTSTVIDHIVDMPTCPVRAVHMTQF